jgi:hypothetical protein
LVPCWTPTRVPYLCRGRLERCRRWHWDRLQARERPTTPTRAEDQANRHAVIGLLRSAATTEHAATLLREFASKAIIGWMAADLDPPNPRLRPTLVASQLIGLFMLRYIIKVEPLASASVEEVVAAVAPTMQRYLTAELNLQPSV